MLSYSFLARCTVNLALGLSSINEVWLWNSAQKAVYRIYVAVQGLSVGLLDADVYGPSIPLLMNLSGQPELSKRMIAAVKQCPVCCHH